MQTNETIPPEQVLGQQSAAERMILFIYPDKELAKKTENLKFAHQLSGTSCG